METCLSSLVNNHTIIIRTTNLFLENLKLVPDAVILLNLIFHTGKPILFYKDPMVKLGEEDITIDISHDVCEVDEVTPGVLKAFLVDLMAPYNPDGLYEVTVWR